MSLNHHNRYSRRTLLVRILCGILAGILILGSVALVLDGLFTGSAADIDELSGYAIESKFRGDQYYVAVSLQWRPNASVSYSFLAPFGFAFGETDVQLNSRTFTPLFLYDEDTVVITCDANLKVWNGECSFAANTAETNIGGYNVELRLTDTEPPESSAIPEIWDTLEDLYAAFEPLFGHVYRAYIQGEKVLRVGAFPDYAAAEAAAGQISASLEGFSVSVASPASQGVTVLNEDCDHIVFEYLAAEDSCSCGFYPRQMEGEDHIYCAYTSDNKYDGVMYFRRYNDGTYNNLTLNNLVRLPEYLEGVVIREIGGYFEPETIKAFAITANSFVVSKRGYRFARYNTDVVASSEDQCYGGRKNVNQNVINACESACDSILTYTNASGVQALAGTAYSSSQGGFSIDSIYTWTSYRTPYLVAQPTMWEDYADVSRGFWQTEVSPTDLCTTVKQSLSGLKGTYITDITYKTTGEVFTTDADCDTPYIYSITFTDNLGYRATAQGCSKVSSVMGNYTYSANFVIGKNSVDYWYDDVLANRIIDLTSTYSGNLSVQTESGVARTMASLFQYITGLGQAESDDSYSLYVKTANGTAVLVSELDMPVTTLPDENGLYTYVSDYNDFLIVSSLRRYEQTKTAAQSGNFVIVGKGWGHGVGMSQYGANHLGKGGAKADQILRAYFPGTEVTSFRLWFLMQ